MHVVIDDHAVLGVVEEMVEEMLQVRLGRRRRRRRRRREAADARRQHVHVQHRHLRPGAEGGLEAELGVPPAGADADAEVFPVGGLGHLDGGSGSSGDGGVAGLRDGIVGLFGAFFEERFGYAVDGVGLGGAAGDALELGGQGLHAGTGFGPVEVAGCSLGRDGGN